MTDLCRNFSTFPKPKPPTSDFDPDAEVLNQFFIEIIASSESFRLCRVFVTGNDGLRVIFGPCKSSQCDANVTDYGDSDATLWSPRIRWGDERPELLQVPLVLVGG